jgi:CubicO group peptidase (beta-lactamase class C family)
MMKSTLIFFLALTTCSGLYSQGLTSQQIDTVVQRARRAFDVPGIAVCVIKDGKIIHSKGYGVRSLNSGKPVNDNTLFGIASNTKAFTTAALGMLVDEGKLSWDDKVRKYIPEFHLYDPYVTEEFTIRDLLCHRSGLGLGAGDLMFFPDGTDFTVPDIIHNLQYLKPASSFRSQYAYDNNLYIVAGEVVARVSGMSWENFIEQRILGPLGMTHSAPSFVLLRDSSDLIDGHARVDGKVQVIRRHQGQLDDAAGGIYSSISDLSKWVEFHLSGGKYGPDGKRLFSEAVLRERWTPQTILPLGGPGPYNTHFATYGFGFVMTDVKGYKQISHTGGLEGMVTQITMIPELHLGIIVLTNAEEGGAFTAITNQIKDSYLGISGTDRVAEYAAARGTQLERGKHITDSIWKEVAAAQKRSSGNGGQGSTTGTKNADWSAYTGVYRDRWFGDVTISMKDGMLWFDARRSPRLTGELLPFKGNSFIVKWVDRSMEADAYVIFDLDERGIPTEIRMKPVSPLTDFSYDFQDLDFHREK